MNGPTPAPVLGPTTPPVLACRNLSIAYHTRAGLVPAVVDFDLTIGRGEAHGLVGESGCGKSSVALAVLRHLNRGGTVTGGQILFEGRDLLGFNAAEMRRIRGAAIAMVYQEPTASLNPSLRIVEQLTEVPIAHDGVRRREARGRAHAMLERVRLDDVPRMLRSYPHELSGGQQQRIVIAMALLSKPRLLLLDEPTTALDVTVEAGIVELIRDLAQEFGTSMLYISHNLGLIRATCDRTTVMYGGEAVERGSVGEVFDDPQHPYTRGLLAALPRFDADKRLHPLTAIPGAPPAPRERPPGCRFGPRCARFIAGRCDSAAIPLRPLAAAPLHACRCVRAEDVPWHTARSGPSALSGLSALSGPSALSALSALSAQGAPSALSAQTAPAVPTASAAQAVPAARSVGEVVLRLREVTKRYGRVLANDAVSLEARRAETVAMVGESGSGKSTLARLVMGLTTATAGSIEFEGSELARLPVTRRGAKTVRALQMIFQDPHGTLNPRRTIGAQLARVIARLGADRDPRRITARVHELLELVRLPREFAARLPRQLSGGQRQRVGIARAFAGDPELVVADEPLAALDVSVQASVTGLLLDIQRARGTTLLFISHDLGMVRYLADRIVVMYQGQVMEQGAAADLLAPPYHPYTELLLASMPAMHGRKRPHAAGSEPAPGRWNAASPRPTAALNPPPGCRFYPRCAHRLEGTCDVLSPPWREFPRTHRIACHLPPARLVGIASVFSEGSA